MSITLMGTVALATDSGTLPPASDSEQGEWIVLPTTPPPPEAIDSTPIPDIPDEVIEEETQESRAAVPQPRVEVIDTSEQMGGLDTAGVMVIGFGIGATILLIGLAGGRNGRRD